MFCPAYSEEDIIKSLMCLDSNMKVFTKDTLPKRHHYTNSDRIANILLDMKDSWIVLQYVCQIMFLLFIYIFCILKKLLFFILL